MWQRDAAVVLDGRGAWEVADIGMQVSRLQRRDDRPFVNDALASEVEDDRPLLHRREPVAVDQMTCGVDEWHVHRQEVGRAEHFVERPRLLDRRRELPRALDRQAGIEPDDVHAKRDAGVRHQAANRAQPDHAERAPWELEARERSSCRPRRPG